MSRATGVQDNEAGVGTRFAYRRIKRRWGRVPLIARIRARDSKLLSLAGKMDLHVAAQGTVEKKLKELAQIKVATMVGCPF